MKAETARTMASMALNSPSSNHFVNDGYTSFSRVRLCSFSFESSLYGFKIPRRQLSLSVNETRTTRPKPACYSGSEPLKASSQSFDVVIVGAGIIGLTIARQFLIGSDLSVAVVDKAVPCSGATGAGKAFFFFQLLFPSALLFFSFFWFALNSGGCRTGVHMDGTQKSWKPDMGTYQKKSPTVEKVG